MANQEQVDTGGGAYTGGDVHVQDGDFVGRDKVVAGDEVHGDKVTVESMLALFAEKNIEGDYVDRRTITNNVLVLGPEALEAIGRWLTTQQDLDKGLLRRPGAPAPPDTVDRQIEEVIAAQGEATARGVPLTAPAAYQLGLLAAYRRDYDEALAYFQQATLADASYSDAFEAIAWLQQSRAMDDIQNQDYDAAMGRLAQARTAATQSDPLDPQALALRGYIAKTLAQIAEARGDKAEGEKYYAEAARFFEGVIKLDPANAAAHNGLGNVHYARGELDAALKACGEATRLAPRYTAAHHDLALAYEGKMKEEPDRAAEWCRRALAAWRQVYALGPEDAAFSAEYLLTIGQRIGWLERRCG
jgi:tetratricopeptide (TPR) repeat protein